MRCSLRGRLCEAATSAAERDRLPKGDARDITVEATDKPGHHILSVTVAMTVRRSEIAQALDLRRIVMAMHSVLQVRHQRLLGRERQCASGDCKLESDTFRD